MTAKAESALTVSQADEAQRCLGCRVSYERGVRYVKGVPGCPVHSGVKP